MLAIESGGIAEMFWLLDHMEDSTDLIGSEDHEGEELEHAPLSSFDFEDFVIEHNWQQPRLMHRLASWTTTPIGTNGS